MRDHLLGCRAFLPPEPEEHINSARAKPFALGIPQRVIREGLAYHRKLAKQEHALDAFEDGDHTPEHMRNDFPREYDLQTMLNEAAGRSVFGLSVYEMREHQRWQEAYNAEMRRLCGL